MKKVELIDVVKRYDKNSAPVVPKLNLDINEGEFICLLGPSGCGKTTTLRMIAGLEHVSDGTIKIDGKVIDCVQDGIFVPPEKRRLGLVFQSYALWPHMTVRENIAFGLKIQKLSAAQINSTVDQVMDTLAIAQYADRYPNQLSGGQQQRVSLARMLAAKPSVLLLDEPLSNLDAKLRLDMRNELKRIHSEFGSTIIFVTHDQWEAMTLATRIALMKEGELQQVSSPSKIYEQPANRFVAEFVGALPINIIEPELAQQAIQFGPAGLAQNIAAVGLRPEVVRLSKITPDYTGPVGKLIDIIPTGGSWISRINLNGQELVSITDAAPALHDGEEVSVFINPEQVLLFDSTGHTQKI